MSGEENDLNWARKRFEVEPFTHPEFGEGYLVFVDDARKFKAFCFARAIPMFSLDSFVFFIPRNPPPITPQEILVGKEKIIVHYPRIRAFDREGREIRGRAKEEMFLLSGLSPYRSEIYIRVEFELPYLLKMTKARFWYRLPFHAFLNNGKSPREGLEMARWSALKNLGKKMLIDLVHKNPWLMEKVPLSLDRPVKSLWEVHKYLKGSDEESLVAEILKHR